MKNLVLGLLLLLTPQVIARESLIPLNDQADRIAIIDDRFGPSALVGLIQDQSLVVVDLVLKTNKAKIPLGFEPLAVVYDPVTKLAYVGGVRHSSIAVVDLAQKKIIADIDLGGGIYDLTLDSKRQFLVATHPVGNRISVVNLTTRSVRSIAMPQPALAVGVLENGWIAVSLNEGPLGIILLDSETGEQLARLRSGSGTEDLQVDNQGKRLILLNSGSEDLSIVPLDLRGKYRTIGLDWKPTRLALSANGRLAYVTSRNSDRLQIVDLDQGVILSTRTLERQPTGIMALADGSYVVVEAGSKTLRWTKPGDEAPLDRKLPVGTTSSAVAGVVKDLGGRPVTQGSLQVQGRSVPVLADGSFIVGDLPEGRYDVTIKVPGYPDQTLEVRTRAGYIKTLGEVQLPPQLAWENAKGVGFLADKPLYSDLLARSLIERLTTGTDRQLLLLNGPLGPAPEFKPFTGLLDTLALLDRDNRLTADLEKLKVMGRSLGLRYLVFTQVQSGRGYDTRGNPLLNTALKLFIPFVPFDIPNFSPNQLRSQGQVVVIDLQKSRVGDRVRFWEASAQDDAGGAPLYDEAADGLFRQEILRISEAISRQWKAQDPFTS